MTSRIPVVRRFRRDNGLFGYANGITLPEVMVAIVVFSVGLLGVAQIMTSVISINAFTRKLTISTTLVQDRIEDIYRVGYANANTLVDTENYGEIPDFESYKRVTAVADNTPTTGMKTVTITVFWDGDIGSTQISTILGE